MPSAKNAAIFRQVEPDIVNALGIAEYETEVTVVPEVFMLVPKEIVNVEHKILNDLKHRLASSEAIQQSILGIPNVIIAPFQKSVTTNFLGISLAINKNGDDIDSIRRLAIEVVSCCCEFVGKSDLWGIEVFICRDPSVGPRKIVRVMIPKARVVELDANEIPNTSRNFTDKEIGCLWY